MSRRNNSDPIGRVPPHSIEAEMAVLGAMLLGEREAVAKGLELLTRADFYRDAHCLIFDAMQSLQWQNKPVDIITLQNEMESIGTLDGIGMEYLLQLADIEFTTSNLAYYAEIVKEKSKRRQLIESCSQIASRAYGGDDEISDLISFAEQEVMTIDETSQSMTRHRIGPMVSHAIDDALERRENGNQFTGLATGLSDIDNLMDGMEDGDLFILAARPSMGKSALAASIALRVAGRSLVGQSSTVAFFSLEMSEKMLRQRFLASLSRVSMSALKRGNVGEEDIQRMQKAKLLCESWPLFVVDKSQLNVAAISAQCRRLKPRLIVVDYLQYIDIPRGSKHLNNTNDIVCANVKAMKNIAREMECPVMLLSQLNRAVDRREDKRPTLSDLRDSGSIEQEADQVAFLYRPSYYERKPVPIPDSEAHEVEFIIAKNRNGVTDTVKIGFFPAWSRFDNLYHAEGTNF